MALLLSQYFVDEKDQPLNGKSALIRPLAAPATRAGLCALGLACATVMASAAPVAPVKAPVHMPQGAFLRAPSPDVTHLVTQVKSDHAVAVRYARLFHLPVKMVPLAFGQLHLKKLTNDHIMQVHFVRQGDKAEQLIYKPRRVKAGTPVYCLPDGTPLLVRVCGNPIRTRVSPEYYSSVPVPDFDASETLTPAPTALGSETASGPPTVNVAPPLAPLDPAPVVAAEGVLPPAELPIAPALPPAGLTTASLPPVYAWAHGPSGLFGLAGLPALFPIIGALGHGSAGSSDITPLTPITPVTPGGGPQPQPVPTPLPLPTPNGPTGGPVADVPEPGVVSLGVALALLGAGSLARRRSRRASH